MTIRNAAPRIPGRAFRALWVAASLLAAASAGAEEKAWRLLAGGGAYASAAYDGSDEAFATAAPYVRFDYERGAFSFRLSLVDGLALTYLDGDRRLLAAFDLGWGAERDPDGYAALGSRKRHDSRTAALLAGSAEVSAPLRLEGKLGWISPAGVVGAALECRPSSEDGGQPAAGFLPSLFYLLPLPIGGKTELAALIRLRFMDETYAETWFGSDGGAAGKFDADSGPRDLEAAVQVESRIGERWGILAVAGVSRLLADAAASPYTTSVYRLAGGAFAFYTF